jgi:hypothetical protein
MPSATMNNPMSAAGRESSVLARGRDRDMTAERLVAAGQPRRRVCLGPEARDGARAAVGPARGRLARAFACTRRSRRGVCRVGAPCVGPARSATSARIDTRVGHHFREPAGEKRERLSQNFPNHISPARSAASSGGVAGQHAEIAVLVREHSSSTSSAASARSGSRTAVDRLGNRHLLLAAAFSSTSSIVPTR